MTFMAKNKEPEEIKVIDRRHSSGNSAEAPKTTETKGEGFTAKDAPNEAHSADQVDFSTLIFSFATSALINLGVAPDPVTKKTEKNLGIARQNIDILGILKDKTKGNLSSDEEHLLESLLTEVRMRFIDASK